MRILVTYLKDDRLTDVPTFEFDVGAGKILVNGEKPRDVSEFEFRLIRLAFFLQEVYELFGKEQDKF